MVDQRAFLVEKGNKTYLQVSGHKTLEEANNEGRHIPSEANNEGDHLASEANNVDEDTPQGANGSNQSE